MIKLSTDLFENQTVYRKNREQMDSPQLKINGHSIVLIGNFNPKIFQPAWFGSEGLIQKKEAEQSTIEIIHPDVVIFSLEWLRVMVTRERFSVETFQEPFDEILRDLVLGTFKLLRYTPITQIGINRDMHFQMESEEKWHAVGHKLAPKELWTGLLEDPGMLRLTMEGKRSDGLKGCIRVTIEPSGKVHPGVSFQYNDHFETKDPISTVGSDEIINILNNCWKESYDKSKNIIYSLLERLL